MDSGPSGAEGRQPGVLGEEEGEKAGRAEGRGPAAGRVPVSPSPSSPPGALVTLRFPPPSSEPQRPPRPALLPFRPHPPARAGPARLAVAPPEAAAAHPCGAAPTRTHGAAGALRVRLRGRRGPGRLGEKGAGKGFRSLGPSWRGDAREDETAAGSGKRRGARVVGSGARWTSLRTPRRSTFFRSLGRVVGRTGREPARGKRRATSPAGRQAPSAATCAREPSSAGGRARREARAVSFPGGRAALSPLPTLGRPAQSWAHGKNSEITFGASGPAGPAAISRTAGGSGFPLPGRLAQFRALLSLRLPDNWGGGGRVCRSWRWQPASATVEARQARPEPP